MSVTYLGQSWLMCPQLPRGFWSGGSNACSQTMNTNTEQYWFILQQSKLNGITSMQRRRLRVNLHKQKPTEQLTPSLCQLMCQHYQWLCLCWFKGCVRLVRQRSSAQWYLNINTKQPTTHERKDYEDFNWTTSCWIVFFAHSSSYRGLLKDGKGCMLLIRWTAFMSLYL